MRKWLITLAVVLACALVATVLSIRAATPRITHNGRTVKGWVLQLYTFGQPSQDAATVLQALGEKAVPDLARLLRDSDPPFKKQVLGSVPSLPAVVRPLVLRLYGSPSGAEVRIAAARALALLGTRAVSAVPALDACMRDREHPVANEAAMALALVSPDAVRLYQSALRDRNVNARRSAAYALGGLGERAWPAVPDLVASLNDPDKWVRDSADGSLWRVGAAAVPAVLEFVSRERGAERERVAAQLANLYACPPSRVPPIATLQFDTAMLQEERARSLRRIAPGEVDPTLARVLSAVASDPSPAVRVAALECLREVNSPTVMMALLHRLQDNDAVVRAEAARTLGTLGDAGRPALFRLRRLANDEQEPVRLAAAEALARIGSGSSNRW